MPLYNYTDPGYLACRAYVRLACMQAAAAANIEKEGAVDSNDALKRGYIVPKGKDGLAPVEATDAPKDGEGVCEPSIENKFCGSLTSDCFCNRPSDAFPECVAYVGQRRECEGEVVKMFAPRSEERAAPPVEAEKSEK